MSLCLAATTGLYIQKRIDPAFSRISASSPVIPCILLSHSRVGGPFIGTRTIRWQHLPAESRESRRDSSETRQSTRVGGPSCRRMAVSARQRHRCPRHCGLDPPVHRDENDEERSSSALKAHTLCQRDRRLVNPEGRCRVRHSTSSPVHIHPCEPPVKV